MADHTVRVQAEPFDSGRELAAFTARNTRSGAVATFIGQMRDVTADGRTIAAMTLEHYPGMAERELTALADDAHRRWPLDDICIIHRHGRFVSGDGIVFVATASSHRAAAFASCEFLMDWLKTKAPFWKKETLDNGEVWVAATGDDDARASRWAPGGVNPAQAAD